MLTIGTDEPVAARLVEAIHIGDVALLRQLLADNPGLAGVRLGNDECDPTGMSRTLLHVATDWPGHYPNGAATVAALVEAGAEVHARFAGPHTETPLHWAASSDDVEVLDALLDAGADIEAPGGVIGEGTPLADAVAFGQWNAARRLVERGARATLWQAAGLGLVDGIEEYFAGGVQPSTEEVTGALWSACHGGQLAAAEFLLARGADINWIGYDDLTPLDVARRSGANDLVAWLSHRGAKQADELRC